MPLTLDYIGTQFFDEPLAGDDVDLPGTTEREITAGGKDGRAFQAQGRNAESFTLHGSVVVPTNQATTFIAAWKAMELTVVAVRKCGEVLGLVLIRRARAKERHAVKLCNGCYYVGLGAAGIRISTEWTLQYVGT